MEFFIAVFGGAFLVWALVSSWGKKEHSSKLLTERKEIETRVNNHTAQIQLRYNFCHEPWELLRQMEDDMMEAFGDDWFDIFKKRPFIEDHIPGMPRVMGFYDVWNAAYSIYLSRNGQINTDSYNVRMIMLGIDPYDTSTVAKSQACNRRVCRVIERNMQKTYGPDMLLWEAGFKEETLFWGYHLDSIECKNRRRPW